MLPFVSVVVITKNNVKTVEKCINNLLNQEYSREYYEIVFVDGHSSDGTDEIIEKYAQVYPIIKLYYEEYGTIGYARNVGINESKGDIIAYIDGDAYPPKDWVIKIVDAFNNDDKLAIIGGLDVLTTEHGEIAGGRVVIDSWRRLKRKVGIKAIPCIKTVNFAIKRSVALACGGFDQELSYWEEPELMARLYVKMGIINILYDPQIYVYHERSAKRSLRQRVKKVFRTSVVGVPVFLREHMIRVAVANLASPIATSVYMILACVLGVPLLVFLTVNGLMLGTLGILLPLYFIVISIYTIYASVYAKKFAVMLPLILTLDSAVRFAGTVYGLIEVLATCFKLNYARRLFRIFAT